MNREFLDFIEDILDGMNKAEALLQWDVVKRDIPQIKPQIALILKEYEG